MTAPGHKPRHRHEEWEYSGWEYAAADDLGRKLRARLLQRTVTERRLRKAQSTDHGSPTRISMGDAARQQQAAIDLTDGVTGDGAIYLA